MTKDEAIQVLVSHAEHRPASRQDLKAAVALLRGSPPVAAPPQPKPATEVTDDADGN